MAIDACDVVIVGGGPAGSSCAWALARAGLDVVVVDAARFPRDKVCAGWITPQVVEDLELDLTSYGRGRTLQAITGFRTGLIGGNPAVETVYDHAVSYGIRRCEFDHYLLTRSGARLRLGAPATNIRRDGDAWIVNDAVRAPMMVGAGGHFCPVARMLGSDLGFPVGYRRENRDLTLPVVAAQEAECAIDPAEADAFLATASTPELFFARDLQGYGWCFRKGRHVNIGFGSLERRRLPHATAAFVAFLRSLGRIPQRGSWPWRGHAYLLSDPPARRLFDDGVMLVGDAAGLAYPQSGEGIRPAVESGLLAASTILSAGRRCTRDRLRAYESSLRQRFGVSPIARVISRVIPQRFSVAAAPTAFASAWFVRHVLIDRWFLHSSTSSEPGARSRSAAPARHPRASTDTRCDRESR